MKKIITGALVLLFAFLIKLPVIDAACSVGVSAPSSAVVGSTFKVTATVSQDVGSWYYVLSYDASKVQLISGSTKVVGVIGDSKTSTYTFKSIASGTASFKAVNTELASNATNQRCSASAGSANVSMKTQAEIEASYSKNNNLASLGVEGAELSPAFNKDTLEYSATLPVDTTKANITGSVADKTATVTGLGEVDVVDGLNKIEIVVTAQHGEKKTYVINLTVEELDPVKVKVNGKNYTVVRKTGLVENIPEGFSESKIKIENQEVACYKNDIAKITLVALKDEEGNISLFIYDESKKEYSLFNQISISSKNYLILDKKIDIPKGFIKKTFKINGVEVTGYKLKDDDKDNYYLVNAQNLETGNSGLYLYDKKENTFQRYYEDLTSLKDKELAYMFYGLLGSLVLILLIILVNIFKGFSSKAKKIRRLERKIAKLKESMEDEEYYDLDKLSDKPNITKIEDDEYVLPKKSRKEKAKELEEAKKRLNKTKPSYRKMTLEDDDDDDE